MPYNKLADPEKYYRDLMARMGASFDMLRNIRNVLQREYVRVQGRR